MSGRHDAPVPQRRRWAPLALDAAIACTPATSLAAALGLAGGGYLVGRADIAACGAVAGAFALAVERLQSRRVRMRLRRERARHRGDLQDVSRRLHELQRDLAGMRADLDEVRDERDAIRAALDGTLDRPAVPGEAGAPAASATVHAILTDPVATQSVMAEPVVAEPVAAEPVATPPVRVPLAVLVPGQVRSPIATGGIPVLAPGPSEPVRNVIDLRAARPLPDDAPTQPIPVLSAELADALVYAALAEADAAQRARSLELPGPRNGRHAGALHTGDAHHAGDYARRRPVEVSGGTALLYVVRRGRHVA